MRLANSKGSSLKCDLVKPKKLMENLNCFTKSNLLFLYMRNENVYF